ncbi:MAG: PEP-CTERM sorting domain-containing protein [Betaproteobacteria bacterium]|nr:PEP-CTERM sorting domain-containing protein [Betaproteobacteria bacterium]
MLLAWNVSAEGERRIEVLWYTYADPMSRYRSMIRSLASVVHTIPASGGIRWHLTFFDPTTPRPAFERFDVLVIQSGEAFLTGDENEKTNMVPDFRSILSNRRYIERARGDRTFLTGSDADLHAMVGDTGNAPVKEGGFRITCNPVFVATTCWDGAAGHVINAINWAAGGRGLGIVSFVAAEFPNSRWWLHPDSFLREELSGLRSYSSLVVVFGPGRRDNAPVIPSAMSTHRLNAGLTSKGLSNWNNSFHAGFRRAIPGYVPVVLSGRYPDLALAIATDGTLRHRAAARPTSSRGPQ